MQTIKLFPILAIFLLSCARKKIHFEKLEQYSQTVQKDENNSKSKGRQEDFYLVHNFSKGQESEAIIDSFACAKARVLSDSFANFNIYFLRSSKKTNVVYLKNHPKYLFSGNFLDGDSGSFVNDYLWSYKFLNGEFDKKRSNLRANLTRNYAFHYEKPNCMLEIKSRKINQ